MDTNSRPSNPAEEFTYRLCRSSFLSLWSYQNPKQQPLGKELCDVLVVCGRDVVIFSVKDITLKNTNRPDVDADRWLRKAVAASAAQIYGAESTVRTSVNVTRNDDSAGVSIPANPRVHRVAVAFGSQNRVPLPYGDFGKGFIHVLDEKSLHVLLGELDTITDFVTYLRAKEAYHASGTKIVFDGEEEDLLALYVHGGRRFPSNYDHVVVARGLWKEVTEKPDYKRRIVADKPSYMWDNLIEIFCRDTLQGNLEFGPGLTNTERAIRAMALETRFARRILASAYKEFLDSSHGVRSRLTGSPSGVHYVFLATPQNTDRKYRVAELGNRCFVARGLQAGATTIVGLGTEQYEQGEGFSLDLVHLYMPVWTPEDQTRMEAMQRDLGYFASPHVIRSSEDEYP
jgi:hypothetical protein